MSMRIVCLFAFVLLSASGLTRAQTACPGGVAAGSAQCGPSPTAHGVNPQVPAQPRIRYIPDGRWIKTWGAIADDQTGTGNIGVSVGKFSKSAASREAVETCESLGGGKCKVTLAYENQCVVIASPSIEGKEVGGQPQTQSAENLEIATELALPKCSKRNAGLECILVYSACSEQVFEKF